MALSGVSSGVIKNPQVWQIAASSLSHFPFSLPTAQLLFASGFVPTRKVPRQMEPTTLTKEEATAVLWGLALNEPEDTRGELRVQIRACEMMYRTLGFEPALQRLSEIANIDAVRTQGRRRDQEAAARLLKHLVSSIKVQRIH